MVVYLLELSATLYEEGSSSSSSRAACFSAASAGFACMLIRRCRRFDVLMGIFFFFFFFYIKIPGYTHNLVAVWICVYLCVRVCFSLRAGGRCFRCLVPFIPRSSFEVGGSRRNLTFHCGSPLIKIELSCFSLKSPFIFSPSFFLKPGDERFCLLRPRSCVTPLLGNI